MVRRIVAALVFSLQLNVMALSAGLVSVGVSPCDRISEPSSHQAATTDMSEMQGMDMSTAPASENKGALPHQSGCNLPWAPGCASPAPCGPTATISESRFGLLPRASAHRVAGRMMQAPRAPDRAPEPPPPRV